MLKRRTDDCLFREPFTFVRGLRLVSMVWLRIRRAIMLLSSHFLMVSICQKMRSCSAFLFPMIGDCKMSRRAAAKPIGSGSGSGNGNGSGYGNGDGDGDGNGSGNGYGYG